MSASRRVRRAGRRQQPEVVPSYVQALVRIVTPFALAHGAAAVARYARGSWTVQAERGGVPCCLSCGAGLSQRAVAVHRYSGDSSKSPVFLSRCCDRCAPPAQGVASA